MITTTLEAIASRTASRWLVAGVRPVRASTRGVRRSYSDEEKAVLLAEAAEPGARVVALARRHGIASSLIHRWRREAEGRPVKPKAGRRPPRLVPLVIGPGVPDAGSETVASVRERVGTAIEVVLRNGRVLRVGSEAEVTAVARLAAALEA